MIRTAGQEDVQGIVALERELFGADAWSADSVLAEVSKADRFAVVATVGSDLVGYAATMRSADLVDLQRIGVSPPRRRKGIARALLDTVMVRAAADGASRMLAEVAPGNRAALLFYSRAGFVEIDRRRHYYRDGSDALVLHATLVGAACEGRRQPRAETA